MDAAVSTALAEVFAKQKLQRIKLAWKPILFAQTVNFRCERQIKTAQTVFKK
jgi:hypothetical protein